MSEWSIGFKDRLKTLLIMKVKSLSKKKKWFGLKKQKNKNKNKNTICIKKMEHDKLL